MSLFQNSVLRQHLSIYSRTKALEAYTVYRSEFLPETASYRTELLYLQAQIDETDREIDRIVYNLYGLSEEEIAVAERG